MRKTLTILLSLLILSTILLTACGGGGEKAPAAEAKPAVPSDYAGKTNPLGGDAASAGKEIYAVNCVSCHGETGMGDGPSAAALDPKPKPLATEMSGLKDDYLFWRISEGGAMEPFNSAMPAWKGSLSEDQIWQVIAHLRTLAK